MFSLNENYTYYLYPKYAGMRKGIESLSELIRSYESHELLNGDVFVFFGRRKDSVKILRWDGDGFILYQKRLEAGTFEVPRFKPREGLCRLSWEVFFMIMRGLPLGRTSFRKRFKIK